MLSWSWRSRTKSGSYVRDYSPQWTPFFSPFPVVTQSASSTGAVVVTLGEAIVGRDTVWRSRQRRAANCVRRYFRAWHLAKGYITELTRLMTCCRALLVSRWVLIDRRAMSGLVCAAVYLSRFSTFIGPGSTGTIRSRQDATLAFELSIDTV